jgi:hypothetical protein
MEKATQPAATAEAGPADDPPEDVRVQGFFVWPPNHFEPEANVPVESLATSTAPAASNLFTTVASRSMTLSLNTPVPQVVGYPLTA